MSVLIYVFAGMFLIGGLGWGAMIVYGMLPARQPAAPARKLPSSADYSVEEEEFRNWIEMRDAIDASNIAARKAHNDVLLALFGQAPPPAAPAKPEAPANAQKSA